MIRVLQIIDGNEFGGIAKLMLDVGNRINGVKFDYLTATNICDDWYNLGVNRHGLKNKIIFNRRLYKFLKNNRYDIIHINSAVFLFSFQVVLIAKLAKIKKVIVHSHNELHLSFGRRVIKKILSPLYNKLVDVKLTCQKDATYSLFNNSKNVITIKNGIDIEKYKYNEKVRNKLKKDLNLKNDIVYGHIGIFNKQKNHDFLIDVFDEIQKEQKNSKLLLIGIGPLESKIKEKVKQLNLEDRVLFLGFREDVNELLNVIDILIFPSLYEGFPVSLVEAQTSGVIVYTSNNINDEVKLTNIFYKIDSNNPEEWKKIILKSKKINRKNAYNDIIRLGYDINLTTKELEKIYKGEVDYEKS